MMIVVTLMVGLLGAWIGRWLALPMGELFGASSAVVVFLKLTRQQVRLPRPLITVVQIILGISIGLSIGVQELLSSFSLLLFCGLMLCMLSQTTANYLWLVRREKWPSFEAMLGAVPGALGVVLMISESQQNPSPRVAFAHSVRLLLLMLMAGFIASGGEAADNLSHQLLQQDIPHLLVLGALAILAGKLAVRLGIPAPYMLTALLVAALYNSYVMGGNVLVPVPLLSMATSILGVLMGSRLVQASWREAGRYARAGLLITLQGVLITLGFALLFTLVTDKPWQALLLAWAPGSVEAMTAVGLLLGLEPAFVAISHVMRLTLLNLAPALFKRPLQHSLHKSEAG
ncbi:AbrB family transcriptional regulator [Aliagarivorans taiwanensis]|uniref:AbrB family transcriptional regulator n=1 Tax=Aliagarivorans taiwanensis TaxID=561966 RepID=UPI000414E460|nr:AbrB family transcriptional regulator [Aliagarivorans taiwanensis]